MTGHIPAKPPAHSHHPVTCETAKNAWPAQNKTVTPTLSRGRPAVPVYRLGAVGVGCYPRVVDNRRVVDNSGGGR
jgi:hypothetical protein